jgi:hypothetical protein
MAGIHLSRYPARPEPRLFYFLRRKTMMKIRRIVIKSLVFIFMIVLISACRGREESVRAVAVDELTVTFEPESCIYEGPALIQAGEVKLIYDNRTEKVMNDSVRLIPDDYTWQDYVEILSLKDTNNWSPDWSVLQSGSVVINDPRAKVYDFKPGLYALACMEITDTGGWIIYPAAPLEVR